MKIENIVRHVEFQIFDYENVKFLKVETGV